MMKMIEFETSSTLRFDLRSCSNHGYAYGRRRHRRPAIMGILPRLQGRQRRTRHPICERRSRTCRGLVKFDFLGLKTLTVIQDAVELVNRGLPADKQVVLSAPDLANPGVYKLISRGDTEGVFSLNRVVSKSS